jgi:hypothetical protein
MARGLHHDGRSLTPGGLLLGALSLGDTQDNIIGRFHHGGGEGAGEVLALSPKFEFLCRAKAIILLGCYATH